MKNWFFDLDGTLARTGEDIIVAWKGALRNLGRDLSHFDEVFSIGPSLEKVVYAMYDDATPELVEQVVASFTPLYDESGFPNTAPYDGIPELLARLKDKGCRIYIVTNKRHIPTQGIAKKFGWDKIFDGIWSYNSFGEKLPKPVLLAKLLRDLNLDPKDCVMVGDTDGDVDSGKKNNMTTYGVSWGYGRRESIENADKVFDSVAELMSVVG